MLEPNLKPYFLEVARDIILKTVDDKAIIVWAVVIIVIVALGKISDAKESSSIVNSALTGLFGLAVGRAWGETIGIRKTKDQFSKFFTNEEGEQ